MKSDSTSSAVDEESSLPSQERLSQEGKMNDPAFFMVGPPRTGTSLLTVLLNSHSRIAIAQDTSVFSEFKDAAISYQKIVTNNFDGLKHLNLLLDGNSIDLIRNLEIDLGNEQIQLLLGLFFSNFFRFHAHDTFIDDPRKDRGTGISYLRSLNFGDIFESLSTKTVSVRQFLNLIINSIIDGEGLTGDVRGEKTPSHVMQVPLISGLYPDAKFINMIRNPISFVGSRKDRVETTIEDHCNLYLRSYSNFVTDPKRSIFVRYEDILLDAESAIHLVHDFLDIEREDLGESLDPGVYPGYVGKKIDPKRDQKNFEATNEAERQEIKSLLSDVFDRHYPD